MIFSCFRLDFDLIQTCIKVVKKSMKSRENRLNYLLASSIATATATVIPTMGVLPAPDNRRRASLQARLQASRGRLLHERCV